MTNEADLIRLARAAIGTRAKERAKAESNAKTAKPNDSSDVPAAPVSRALARKRADAYAAFVVATAKAATAARRKGRE
jgi:hypothetical protein